VTQTTLAQTNRGFLDFKGIFRKYGIVAILLGLCLILSIVSPAFRTLRNVTNIIRQVSAIGLISIGVTFCIVTGGIDLSTGSVVGLISVICASMAQNQFNPDQPISIVMPLVFTIVIALGAGSAVGLVNGAITAYGNIPPFIATLGMMTVARGVAQLYSGGRPIGRLKDGMVFMGSGSFFGIPIPILIYLLIAVFAWVLLSRSRFGKHVTAIGCNIQAARICGINIKRTLVLVYIFCGFTVAVAAIIITGRTAGGNPAYGLGYELDAIAATVIGGTSLAGGIGSIPLCVVGALIIGVINNGMDLVRINPYWQQIVKGTIIVVAVLIDARRQKKA
jgi:inositol transport system permease protein